jgi:hypothetical protein
MLLLLYILSQEETISIDTRIDTELDQLVSLQSASILSLQLTTANLKLLFRPATVITVASLWKESAATCRRDGRKRPLTTSTSVCLLRDHAAPSVFPRPPIPSIGSDGLRCLLCTHGRA